MMEEFQELPDDLCEACGKEVAEMECAHGILCSSCAKQIHGMDNECEL